MTFLCDKVHIEHLKCPFSPSSLCRQNQIIFSVKRAVVIEFLIKQSIWGFVPHRTETKAFLKKCDNNTKISSSEALRN